MKRTLIISNLLGVVIFVFVFAYGDDEVAGKVYKIDNNAGEIQIKIKRGTIHNIGQRLQVEIAKNKIVLEVTFPMQTLSKCKIIGKGEMSQLKKGMIVYKYREDEPEKVEPEKNETVKIEPVQNKKFQPGETKIFGNIQFVFIPGGAFIMGSPKSEKDRNNDEIQHKETLLPFWMGKYEVSQNEYMDVMGENPSFFSDINVKNSNLPVENVSWYDAVEFCNKLSKKYGLKPYYSIKKNKKDKNNKDEYDYLEYIVEILGGNGFRLPTEAEWEYACRAGTETVFHYGNKLDSTMANFNGEQPYNAHKGIYRAQTTPQGSFKPNNWGLYDMHGNVWEWCYDWYGSYIDPKRNSKGVNKKDGHVLRGGSWYYFGYHQRSAIRNKIRMYNRISGDFGFRIARSIF